MLFLGVDPGIATTGYGLILEDERGIISEVTHGVIKTPTDQRIELRLQTLYTELTALILLHQPKEAAVEKLYFARNVTSGIAVGEARGVVLLVLSQAGIHLGEYSPLEVKQAVVGYGGADKHQVQEMVKAILALPAIPKPDDAADALAIAICHAHSYRHQRLEEGFNE
jgi:crossover junction endodeoxyribonuclease RuvC